MFGRSKEPAEKRNILFPDETIETGDVDNVGTDAKDHRALLDSFPHSVFWVEEESKKADMGCRPFSIRTPHHLLGGNRGRGNLGTELLHVLRYVREYNDEGHRLPALNTQIGERIAKLVIHCRI